MQKLNFAEKAQQILLYNAEIEKLRAIFNTPNDQISDLELICYTTDDKMPVIVSISNPEKLKAYLNDYMPTVIAKRDLLEHEINQFDKAMNG